MTHTLLTLKAANHSEVQLTSFAAERGAGQRLQLDVGPVYAVLTVEHARQLHTALGVWLQTVALICPRCGRQFVEGEDLKFHLADEHCFETLTGVPVSEAPVKGPTMEIARKPAGDWYYKFPAGRWPDEWKWLADRKNTAREALEYAQGATQYPVVVVDYTD